MKAIRWQIPFVSVGGTHYRIDIYDEESQDWDAQNPVQLTGGTSPLSTSEDDSDDYFEPIRTQSGTIEVCTLMPDGNYITLDDLLPANNIARPVKLWRILGGGAVGMLEWQGFLSCEAYDQDYTSIPQIIQLPVISVLEAMASVQLDPTISTGLQPIYICLHDILKEIDRQSGITCFTHLNYSRTDYRIISKYIDMTVMFEQKEYNNENSTTYIVSGLSAKDALERLCTYMGWIAREKGTEIYLQRIGEEIGMFREEVDEFPGVAQQQSITEAGIAATFADKWRGTDHQRTVSQGAKSVEVVAKLKDGKVNISMPEFPAGEVVVNSKQLALLNTATYRHLYAIISQNYLAYDSIQFRFFKGTSAYQNYNNEPTTDCYEGVSTFEEAFPTIFLNNPGRDLYTMPRYAGAFYIKIANEEEETDDPLYSNGIYLSFIPGLRIGTTVALNTEPIFKYTTPLSYSFQQGGTFKLEINAFEMMGSFGQQGNQQGISSSVSVLAHLRIGNNYWNGSGWVQSPTTFELSFEAETTISSVLAERMEGQIELAFYPHGVMSKMGTPIGPHGQIAYRWALYDEVVISRLNMSYEATEDPNLTDRSENHYFRLLGTNFRDEISIETELASTLNNRPSPSLIMNSETEAMTELNYGTDQVPDMRRPEVDLLNRLAEYYQAARHRLSLIVEHPTVAPLPLLRLNGISPDNRKYLPLAEERDWQQETCTLTCFETPTDTQESQS